MIFDTSELLRCRDSVVGVLQNTYLSKEERGVAIAVAFLVEVKKRDGKMLPDGSVLVDEAHVADICGDFRFPPISQTGLQRWLRRTNYGQAVAPAAVSAEVAGLLSWYLHPNLAALWREMVSVEGDS